ncbi:UDP-N-acetylmuramate dehydrogenase [Candidatus Saccharibacteria bacterium]|nr:UDP-N-acetylmuramate dehydrogenase [Candidatus Saccharibacteria bacterium]MCB9834810.1 UDP-N-acetylmuramate dehydrogenase [Candidatus Nomurabacteria bacterium]
MKLKIEHQFDLSDCNTLGLRASAKSFAQIDSQKQLEVLTHQYQGQSIRVLGSGSNTVLASDLIDGLVLRFANQEVKLISQDQDISVIEVGAGMIWDQFVEWSVDQGFAGLESLSLIPGTVGSSVIQNIGAYGYQSGDYVAYVRVWDNLKRAWKILPKGEINFAYRDSIFKRDRQLLVYSVGFALKYGDLAEVRYGNIFSQSENIRVSPAQLRARVIKVRMSKFGDIATNPSAGSFFHNPFITKQHLEKLQSQYPDIVHFDHFGQEKVAAGWLIEQLGYKGQTIDGWEVSAKNALVLINRGGSAKNLINLASKIQEEVRKKFTIDLEIEPTIW